MKKLLLITFTASFFASCTSSRVLKGRETIHYDAALADSILAYALDHEALYTLADTLKPISSVKFLKFPVAKDSSMNDGDAIVVHSDSLLQEIERYQRVCDALSTDDWQFLLVPFKRTEKNMRNLEIYVIRRSKFKRELAENPAFWGQWGFTTSADPSVVLPVIEYETKLDRNRAYGYLFGYPDYAVDFFIDASRIQEKDTTHKLVPRDFFAIPVYAGDKGYFTYAMPQGMAPSAIDSSIYHKATQTLERYKAIREKYKTSTGIKAAELWRRLRKGL